jgi:hypothetical protein
MHSSVGSGHGKPKLTAHSNITGIDARVIAWNEMSARPGAGL